jgi:phosphatidylglycerophosphatase A
VSREGIRAKRVKQKGFSAAHDREALRNAHPADRVAVELACIGPVGRLPVAPGTWGSLVAVVFAPWLFMPLDPWARLAVLVLIFFGGAFCAGRAERILGRKDPQPVVVDEVLGQLICFAPFMVITLWELIIGFFLFRLLDIIKPFPVRRSESWLPGGYGIMLDDLLAGAYAAVALGVIHLLFFVS